jgi:hypothetical protein
MSYNRNSGSKVGLSKRYCLDVYQKVRNALDKGIPDLDFLIYVKLGKWSASKRQVTQP